MDVEMETKLDRDTRQKGALVRDTARRSILPSLSKTLLFDTEHPTCQEIPVSGTLGCLIAIWVFWLQAGLSREYSVHTMRFPAEEELLPSAECHTDGLMPPMDWGLC